MEGQNNELNREWTGRVGYDGANISLLDRRVGHIKHIDNSSIFLSLICFSFSYFKGFLYHSWREAEHMDVYLMEDYTEISVTSCASWERRYLNNLEHHLSYRVSWSTEPGETAGAFLQVSLVPGPGTRQHTCAGCCSLFVFMAIEESNQASLRKVSPEYLEHVNTKEDHGSEPSSWGASSDCSSPPPVLHHNLSINSLKRHKSRS